MAENEDRKSQRWYPGFLPDETAAHAKAAREELRRSVESLLPPGFIQHRRAARREMLLAFRSLIDAALEEAEGSKAESG